MKVVYSQGIVANTDLWQPIKHFLLKFGTNCSKAGTSIILSPRFLFNRLERRIAMDIYVSNEVSSSGVFLGWKREVSTKVYSEAVPAFFCCFDRFWVHWEYPDSRSLGAIVMLIDEVKKEPCIQSRLRFGLFCNRWRLYLKPVLQDCERTGRVIFWLLWVSRSLRFP